MAVIRIENKNSLVNVTLPARKFVDAAGLFNANESVLSFRSDQEKPRLLNIRSQEIIDGKGAVEGNALGREGMKEKGSPIVVRFEFSEPLFGSTRRHHRDGCDVFLSPTNAPRARFSPLGIDIWEVLCFPLGNNSDKGTIRLVEGVATLPETLSTRTG